jgi:hypothetical protein
VQPFRDLLSDTPEQYRPTLTLMADWTEELASTNHNITAATNFGLAGDVSLLPRLKDENVGLVTLWRYNGGKPAISFWRSVFERRAPQSIAPTERLIGKPIGQGTTTNQVTSELLTAIENAYLSASSAGR